VIRRRAERRRAQVTSPPLRHSGRTSMPDRRRRRTPAVLLGTLGAALLAFAAFRTSRPVVAAPAAPSGDPALQGVTDGTFIANHGQWDAEARFRSTGGGGEVWFAASRLMYAQYRFPHIESVPVDPEEASADEPAPEAFADAEGFAVEVKFAGANQDVAIDTGEAQPGVYNWLKAGRNVVDVPAYKNLTYVDLWDGVDLRFYGDASQNGAMKSVLVVAPGADATQIGFVYDGQTALRIDERGNLVIETPLGDIVEAAPVALTEDGRPVAVRFLLNGSVLTFRVAPYDTAQALYIDPSVIFSRDFGTTTTDFVTDMKENANGRYLLGTTFGTGFPIVGGFRAAPIGTPEWYIIQFNAANDTQLASTYLGGSSSDYSGSMELLPNGDVVVSGYTLGQTFPGPGGVGIAAAPVNTIQTTSYNAAIAQMNSAVNLLLDSAMFGGNGQTTPSGLARNAGTGEYYLTGQTFSTTGVGGLGPAGGFQPAIATSPDGFVTRLSSNFDTATAFTYLGGTSTDGLVEVTLDAAGNAFVGGFTFSTVYPFFARTAILGPGNNGTMDFILGKLNSALSGFTYITTVGGASTDGWIGTSYLSQVFGVMGKHMNFPLSTGQLLFTGCTLSTDYPTAGGPFQTNNAGNYDQAVSVLNATGTALDESTYLGGASTDEGSSVEQNGLGNLWVTGLAASANFPVLNAVQATNAGNYDFTLTLFNGTNNLSTLLSSTYWGGSSTDFGIVIFDGPTNYRARVAGPSASANWPQVPGGSATFGPGGGYDGAVVDINFGGANLLFTNLVVIPLPTTHNLKCLTAGDFVDIELTFTNNGLTAQANNPGPEFSGVMVGPSGGVLDCVVVSGGGVCTFGGNNVAWNGSIAPGGSVTLRVSTRVAGGVPAGSTVCIQGTLFYDADENGTNESQRSVNACAVTDCPPTVDPNRQQGKQIHLPILNFQGQDDVCRTWIEVQVVGNDFAKAVLVTWGEPGFCPPQCAGPLKVECTGLLKPGSTWNILGAQIPTGSKGGMLFKFSARQISQLFPGNGGDDDIVADAMCEDLFFGVVGDCDDYRRFKKAYNEGLDWGPRGLNMGVASGDGYLAVDVLRHCPGDVTPGVEVSSKYNGIAGDHLGAFDPVFGGYAFYIPLLYAEKAGYNAIAYIQNGGLECSSIEIWFKAQDDCLRARICEIFTLAPGETYQFDASDCVGPDWQGSAWVRSTQPLGIVVDIIGRDVLMTYVGEPAELSYFVDPIDPDKALYTPGNQVAYGPLMYSEYQGWDTGVQVQNLSAVRNAKVKVYFLDRGGDIITTLVDWICPRGSQTFFLPVIAGLPGSWVGSVRVESQEWWTPGEPAVFPANIVGVASLIKYNDAARTTSIEALAYNLLPEHKAYDWQIGFGGGGLDSGIGLIAVPSVLKDLEGTGLTTELAIANLVPKPGFTDFAIFFYDQNGLLDNVCEKLNEKQVEYVNLQTWGFLNPGFKGSAIISAMFWEHDVFDETGFFLRNLVGLGVVSVERSGTRLGEDVPGDEAAGERGIPFRPDASFAFDFEGPNAPNCPGVPQPAPTAEPEPTEGPALTGRLDR
jgi:hypothetical protein